MDRDMRSFDSLASFLSLCQTTVGKDEEEPKNALAVRAEQMVEVLKLDLRATHKLVLDGRHPLVEACRTGNIKIVQMFINHGASLNFVDPDGRSPLYAAIVGRNCTVTDIRQILHWGADVNLHKDGKLPLFASLYCMGPEVSRLLISEGADVNNVVLTCFCFIESVFALNTTLIMVMSGFQLQQFEDLPAMVALALDIILAGLSPKTFYLSSGKRIPSRSGGGRQYQMEEETLVSTELALLWRLQHLCLSVGFRVDHACMEVAIAEVREQLDLDGCPVPSEESLIARADGSIIGVSNSVSSSRLFSSFGDIQEAGRGEEPREGERMIATQAEELMGPQEDSHQAQSKRSDILLNKLSQLLWMQRFQASPLPLTFLTRMCIRGHLSQPRISRGKHIDKSINALPVPRIFRDFLTLKDYRKSFEALL